MEKIERMMSPQESLQSQSRELAYVNGMRVIEDSGRFATVNGAGVQGERFPVYRGSVDYWEIIGFASSFGEAIGVCQRFWS